MPLKFYSEIADKNIPMSVNHVNAIETCKYHICIYLAVISLLQHRIAACTSRLYLTQVKVKIQSVEKCFEGTAKPHLATTVMCDSI